MNISVSRSSFNGTYFTVEFLKVDEWEFKYFIGSNILLQYHTPCPGESMIRIEDTKKCRVCGEKLAPAIDSLVVLLMQRKEE